MFIITGKNGDEEGAFSVVDDSGEKVLYIFEEEDDATRFSLQLEDMGLVKMDVVEVDDELMIKTCEFHDHRYTIITSDDIVIPPGLSYDTL